MNNFHMREGKIEFRWKRWRNKKRQEVSSCLMVLFSGAVLLGAGGVALAGPTGGQVTGGQGTITNPNGTTTNINQQSNVLSINWQDFSIQQGETVNFYQPGSTSVAINRVIGGVPSYLAGALNANGRVFILNSAGITFTGTSQVNVGALLATTAMTVNGDPTQAASYSGSGYGAVINQGSISVSNGGFAILAAPYVQNTGFIKADLGTIALAGTNQFTLDLSGTGLINFVVPAGAVEKIVSDGKAVGVDNAGTLQARSGQVLISANVASEVVNAVVNLNGIVDADAFAANGQGGSVLVTSQGDINVGGQVTARGNGTGNGGQIVTKAGSNDVIGQLAFVSAAGGAAGGVGGNIEVSGKTVGLNGSIDPGKGGLLYIDPLQFTIRNGTSGQSASGIGERKLEKLLRNGAGFSVAAAGNITIQDLSDNYLAGGPGDLTLHAGTAGAGNIIVQGVADMIRTASGDITLTAAGNIGDSAHRLILVSGTGLPGVTQAGDIVLTAGQDVFLSAITAKSAAGAAGQARSADVEIHAGHNIDIAGAMDVEATASGAHASAEVNLFANGHITDKSMVTIFARTHGANGSLAADAELIAAAGHTVSGNNVTTPAASSIHFYRPINIQALATGDNSGVPVELSAKSEALLAARQITMDGAVHVKATASSSNFNANPIGGLIGDVEACATLIAGGGTQGQAAGYWERHLGASNVHFRNSIDVAARSLAGSSSIALAGAHASAQLYGVNLAVDGAAIVDASVQASGAARDIAAARLIEAGSANSQAYGIFLRDFRARNITLGRNVEVEAFVNGETIVSDADALALAAFAGNNVTIGGNITVLTSASGHGLPSAMAGTVFANPHLSIGTEVRRSDTALGFFESGGAARGYASNVHIGGAVNVEAVAAGSYLDNGQGVYGNATADIRGAVNLPNSIIVNGPVAVLSHVTGSHVISASAGARVIFHVGAGKLLVPEHILIDAEASGDDANLTCAEARAHFYSTALHCNATVISSEGIVVTAGATGNGGLDFAGNEVFATASVSAQIGHIKINPGAIPGDVFVQAEANGFHVNNIIASDGLFLKSLGDVGSMTVNVPLIASATAHGTGRGSHTGEILAVTVMTLRDPSIALNPVGNAIDLEAHASGHSASDITGNVQALIGRTPGDVLSINAPVIADADARGSFAAGTVHATALFPIVAKGATIRGIEIDASASGSHVGNNVTDSAQFYTHIGSHGVVIGSQGLTIKGVAKGNHVGDSICDFVAAGFSSAGPLAVDGPLTIVSKASGDDAHGVTADAYLLTDSHNTPTREFFDGAIDVEAYAKVGRDGASFADALTSINLATPGDISIVTPGASASAIKALASADPLRLANFAGAQASVDVNAGGDLTVNGNVTVQAHALGRGAFGPQSHDDAHALLNLTGPSVTIIGNLRSLALADGSFATANATIEIHADGNPGDIHLFQQKDPLARATAGLVAISRQAHVSTSGVITGTHGSAASVDIDITHTGPLTVSRRPRHF